MKMMVVAGDTKFTGVEVRKLNYRFVIYTGPRCGGLMSRRKYSTHDKAWNAGERMVEKLTK